MPYTVDDIVNFAVSKNHIGLKDALDDVMVQRAADAIEARKEVVGKSFSSAVEDSSSDDE